MPTQAHFAADLNTSSKLRALTVLFAAILALSPQSTAAQAEEETWDVTAARGETREIDFTTSEGTWMSVDQSPDGAWIVFDLLGHIYRVSTSGGPAELLTSDVGVSVSSHPRYSPDGTTIAFVSDRGGQNNLWIMDAEGANPRAVFEDPMVRVVEPAWSADGDYIFVRRSQITLPGQPPGDNGIWMYHRDGGTGVEVVASGDDTRNPQWPSPSADGRYLYFHVYTGPQALQGRDALAGHWQVMRKDLRDGEVTSVTSGVAQQQVRLSSGGAYAAEVSPDGRWLAFMRRIPDGTISFRGHRYGPRTALWVRDLEAGAERVVMDPVTSDNAEGIKTLRIAPGYGWDADGGAIVISQGGKIRRLDLLATEVETIPFEARVQRTISEMSRADFRITDDPFQARFLRWASASPAGDRIVFQAVGRVWSVNRGGGAPSRITAADFRPFEFSPTWSPDGRWIAFTTWDDDEGGHVWKVRSSGGDPERLTETPGEYLHPEWAPGGDWLVVSRGAGAPERGRGTVHNPYWDLVAISTEGERDGMRVLTRVSAGPGGFGSARSQITRVSFGPESRVFFPQPMREDGRPYTALASIDFEGMDRRIHLTFPFADEVAVSPNGRRVAFQEGDNVYVAPMPWPGTGEPLRVEKRPARSKVPVTQLSRAGGLFPRWRSDSEVEFNSGPTYYAHDVSAESTDTVAIQLLVPRPIPGGSVALTDARIVTLRDGEVIERGTVVVEGARITCVGECDVSGIDRRIDASGTTIIPGFVDMHAHHYREHRGLLPRRNFEAAIYLAYGVTTNLDNSMWSQNVFPTAELIHAGEVVGPRTYSTGDPIYRGDGARRNEISSREVAEDNVERLRSWGATAVKQYLQPRRDQRQWVTDAARERGMMVTSEGSDIPYTISMIMDGHTGFEHPLSYVPLYSDASRFLGEAGAVYSPTVVVGGPGPWNEEYFFAESDVWRSEKQRRWMPWRQIVPHMRRRWLRPDTDYSFPLISEGLADVIRYGGLGAVGSHGQAHGIAPHWEVWMYASALGPMGALEVASVHGARFLGAEDDIGSIEVGKLADLMVLDANPLDDIRNTTAIRWVMQGGVLRDGVTLDELWPTERPYGEGWWVDPNALLTDDRPVDWWDRSR